MAEKKEILDYLRNRQKAAEIDAKVNGINLWVLLGALVLVMWHLLGSADSPVWLHQEILLRTIAAALAGYLFVEACASRFRRVEHIRFTSWRVTDMDTPFLDILQGLVVIVPPALLWAWYRDWTGIVTAIFGFISLVSGIAATARLIRGENPEGEQFPEPDFVANQRAQAVGAALLTIALAAVLAYQVMAIEQSLPKPPSESAKVLGAVAVFYVLCLLSLRRRKFGESTRWTYELETDLLLDAVSTDVALRRIEHRALGPRLQDIMDKFFDGLDKKLAEIERVRSECMAKLDEVAQVPKEYEAERDARAKAATAPMNDLLEAIDRDFKEFALYLKRLEEKLKAGAGSAFAAHVVGLRARHAAYVSRASEFKSAIRHASPLVKLP